MPTLPAWPGFTGNALNADELSIALWSTADPNDSFDILNGGLTDANYPTGKLPTWATQPGSFVAGYYYGFDRRDIITASQQVVSSPTYTIASNEFGYGLVSSFSHKVFLPFDCEAVFFSFQAWCKQVCTFWTGPDGDVGGTSGDADIAERFVVSPYVNGVRFPGLVHKLPAYTHSESAPDGTLDYNAPDVDPLLKWEYRWRYISGSGFFVDATDTTKTTGQADKGVLTFDIYVYGNIQSPNQNNARISIDSGGLTLIAIR